MKAALAINGIIGTWGGPDEPGTAYVMLHHSIGDVGDGHLGSWGFPEGGMGAVSEALRKSAESFGCEVRTERAGGEGDREGRHGRWASCSRTARSCSARSWSRPSTRRSPSCKHLDSKDLPADFVDRHRALEDPQRRREDQPRALRAARLHGEPGHAAAGSPQRLRRAVPVHASTSRRRSRTRRRGAPRAGPSWTASSRATGTRRSLPRAPTSCRCSRSGCRRSGRTSRTPRSSRPTPTGSSTATTELAPNFKQSILHRQVLGPVGHGAGVSA